jgi:protein-S-isoprenylcysteine O-methyltransferase Ste14
MAAQPPNRIPWPPLIYGGAAVLGVVLNHQWPFFSLESDLCRQIGVALLVAGIALDFATMLAFRRHRTTIMPHRSATHLITSGPFGHSRNPIYLANTMLLMGLGLSFDWSWVLLLALPAAYVTQKLAIEREERHLAETFGEAWTTYAANVPRWLLWL